MTEEFDWSQLKQYPMPKNVLEAIHRIGLALGLATLASVFIGFQLAIILGIPLSFWIPVSSLLLLTCVLSKQYLKTEMSEAREQKWTFTLWYKASLARERLRINRTEESIRKLEATLALGFAVGVIVLPIATVLLMLPDTFYLLLIAPFTLLYCAMYLEGQANTAGAREWIKDNERMAYTPEQPLEVG